MTRHFRRGAVPAVWLTIFLAACIGILAALGAVLFSFLIEFFTSVTLRPALALTTRGPWGWLAVALVPALGLLIVAWFTRRFAPEAEGHGVPEVIAAVARKDGIIRPRVAVVKILASGFCIGTGGSVGREGPIVQIGSSLGSLAGQLFKLSPPNVKVLVAAGAAAGISATFNAPLAGVVFASEIILGSFAVESLTPIVVASVLADVVQTHIGEHGLDAAFPHIYYAYAGSLEQLPSYVLLGVVCGLAAVGFTKLLYFSEDRARRWLPRWWLRALVLGVCVGALAVAFQRPPPNLSPGAVREAGETGRDLPPLLGVGYGAVNHALHLVVREPGLMGTSSSPESPASPGSPSGTGSPEGREAAAGSRGRSDSMVRLAPGDLLAEFWWLLPLALLKPLATSLSLAGGGSGGIFAPSLFIGAMTGGAFGVACNLVLPEWSGNPGLYAIVGMGAVVAGTTHGVLSATLIVYEMTNDYQIILPIMVAAGLSSVIAQFVDPESIYYKKLSRRGESIARGHDMHRLEHIMVRDVMIREFPTVRQTDNASEIIRVARANTHIESLPVMDQRGKLLGIIRPEDLHRVLDTDIEPHLLQADDIALMSPISVSPDANLLEALRDFGTRDVETLPVVEGRGASARLVGLLVRADVIRRYRLELLRHRS
ncbi:MAG: chloride channel protein [Pirellulaceae bacterium]|nr:chloride channel protein [Pirellulaceae bacterium]